MKSKLGKLLMASALMGAVFNPSVTPGENVLNRTVYTSKAELTKKQAKARAASKRAKKARKINYRRAKGK